MLLKSKYKKENNFNKLYSAGNDLCKPKVSLCCAHLGSEDFYNKQKLNET